MRILMMSPACPIPAQTGGLVRIERILSGLAQYHSITFVAPFEPSEKYSLQELTQQLPGNAVLVPTARPTAIRKFRSVLSIYPYHVSLYNEPKIASIVSRLLETEQYSLIYLHFLYTLSYIPRAVQIPVVVDQQNVDRVYWMRKASSPGGRIAWRLAAGLNLYKTIWFENRILHRVSGYVSVSELDRKKTMVYASSRVPYFLVAPNGVDCQYHRQRFSHANGRHIVLGFFGSLDLALNQDAARILCCDILPLVRAQSPDHDFSVLLIGRNPPASIQRLAANDPSIRVTGTVEDVRPFLEQVDVLVLPLREGAGTKLRTLEAMATGLPIVGTPLAFEGIDGLVDGLTALVAKDVHMFVSAILGLVQKPETRSAIGMNARCLVEQKFSWQSITERLAADLNDHFAK
ncbi:MAG: glycosyltransferase [Anaerolineae bacterium]|nr:glycosyltransferase [Anaerolineae bacterium]